MRKASIIPVFLVLSACGGGGGSPTNPTFEAQRNQAFLLCDQYNCNSPVYADYADVVDVLSEVTYTGVAAYSIISTQPGVIITNPLSTSEMELIANFSTTPVTLQGLEVSGRFFNFQSSEPNTQYSGELSISGSIVQDLLTGIAGIDAADVSGDLVVNGSTILSYDGTVDAAFPSNADAVFGNGTIIGGGDTVNIAFIGER